MTIFLHHTLKVRKEFDSEFEDYVYIFSWGETDAVVYAPSLGRFLDAQVWNREYDWNDYWDGYDDEDYDKS